MVSKIEKLLSSITDFASEMYAEDPCKPGVLISKLHDNWFYVSLCRFTEHYGKGKVIITKTEGPDLEVALIKIGWTLADRYTKLVDRAKENLERIEPILKIDKVMSTDDNSKQYDYIDDYHEDFVPYGPEDFGGQDFILEE